MTIYEDSVYLVCTRDRYGFRITEMRKNKPAMKSGQVAVKVKLRIPKQTFDEFIPEVLAEIGTADIIPPEVKVVPPLDEYFLDSR